jgi:cytidyltransferase-like protein
MIGISADFDPLHKGHVKLLEKAREISDETGGEVVVYLNKGYSANHAPFFVSYDARMKMAIKAGADRVMPIEGLHYRLTMAYTVPIRIARMLEDGVVDFVDAADISISKIKKFASSYVKRGIFSGISRNLPNRNVIRWFAVNEFLYKRYGRKLKFHIIPKYKINGDVSGRNIRRGITNNNLKISKDILELLPDFTVKILKKEIKKGNIPEERNIKVLKSRLNTYSRSKLLNIAYLNADAVNEIVKGRSYRVEGQIWAAFRKAGYGPVLTRLAISALEENVTRLEVFDLIKEYQAKKIIPPDQKVENMIERAWFVASKTVEGIASADAHKMFREGDRRAEKPPFFFDGGMHLRNFEVPDLKAGMSASLYVDRYDRLCCNIRSPHRKIKSLLILPAKLATYLRFLIDSHFIPIQAQIVEKKEGLRVRIFLKKCYG